MAQVDNKNLDSMNPQDVLTDLLKLRDKLFSPSVTEVLRKRSKDEKAAFVTQRMKLSEEILRLEAAQLSTLRQALERHGADLNRGTLELTESLEDVEEAARWAQGIGSLLSVVSRIVPVV